MKKPVPYNPLDKRNLGANVAEALLEQEVHAIDDLEMFEGAGIYAIYYTGDFAPYEPVSSRNRDDRFEWPIYVGKAVPAGSRKGAEELDTPHERKLRDRLLEHRRSIRQVDNLNVEDFHCRFLVVDETFIALGETLMIAKFATLWNKIVDGFGNHGVGSGRNEGMRSRWDVVHRGRPWANRVKERNETAEQILIEAESFMRGIMIPAKPKLLRAEE